MLSSRSEDGEGNMKGGFRVRRIRQVRPPCDQKKKAGEERI